jgi:2-haloacid dehalogenase
MPDATSHPPRAVLFDLLTALLDSWTLWNTAAESEAAGRSWRAAYLKLTYGCGAYRSYEQLVAEAAASVGLTSAAPQRLHNAWDTLSPWSGAQKMLDALTPHCKLAVVTNCSTQLGRRAAARLNIAWDAIITAEGAGFYKPHPRPYQMALELLGVSANEACFVAGSRYDLFGTSVVGLRTYWHNRIGLSHPPGAPLADKESRTLDDVVAWVAVNHD